MRMPGPARVNPTDRVDPPLIPEGFVFLNDVVVDRHLLLSSSRTRNLPRMNDPS